MCLAVPPFLPFPGLSPPPHAFWTQKPVFGDGCLPVDRCRAGVRRFFVGGRPTRTARAGRLWPRGERSASSKRWAAAGLIGLYAVALAGFYALGVVRAQVLWVLAGLAAAGFAVFGAVFRFGLQRKRRLRHVKPKEGGRNEVVIDQAIAIGDTAVGGLVGTHWPRVPVATGCSREPQTIADARGPREGRSGRQVVEVRVSKVAQSRRSAGALCVAHRRSHPPRSGLRRLSAASL